MPKTILAVVALIANWSSIAQADDVPAPATRPNIILILSDDVGLGDIHCYGGPFNTPHIDQLATEGTRFTCCYATPLCGPSRCELLTGRYPFRTGLISNQSRNAVQPAHEVMIPTILKRAGYVTGSVGKWGQICLGPAEWGFDEYLVFPGSGRYWRAQTKDYTVDGRQVDLPKGKYLPDIMDDYVTDFIKRHKDYPFFLYYPMSHIHGPIVPTPDSKPDADNDQLYVDNVAYMDQLVGRLVKTLEQQHLREKTVVIFAGDNGTARFGVNLATLDGQHISGMKGTMLEGGSRVPLIVNWSGVTPAGKANHDLVDFSDFFATVAELTGAELPQNVTLDSHSFAPQIRGEAGSPREWIYVELNGKSYARGPRYKLTNSGDLFDLAHAPFAEILVAKDSQDPAATAARTNLQQVLDDHKAAPGHAGGAKALIRRIENAAGI